VGGGVGTELVVGGGTVTDVTDRTASCESGARWCVVGLDTKSEVSPSVRPTTTTKTSGTRLLERRRRCLGARRDRRGDTFGTWRRCRACRADP